MNKQSLESIAQDLKEILGTVWTIRVYSAKECAVTGVCDPPCAYIEAKFRLESFTIDIDGVVVNSNGDEAFTLPRRGGHKERMRRLTGWLRGEK